MTTEVAADVATLEPLLLEAVTLTRSVWPRSADTTPYDELVAPPIEAQALPDESQRSHSYAYELTRPLQLPLLADTVFPTTGNPLTAGKDDDVGGC